MNVWHSSGRDPAVDPVQALENYLRASSFQMRDQRASRAASAGIHISQPPFLESREWIHKYNSSPSRRHSNMRFLPYLVLPSISMGRLLSRPIEIYKNAGAGQDEQEEAQAEDDPSAMSIRVS